MSRRTRGAPRAPSPSPLRSWPRAVRTPSATPRSSRRARRCGSRIGTQEFPEARILGELWRQALAVNGYTVDLRKGVGPAEDLDQALNDGDIDGYVAYTGTVLSIVAGEEVSGLDPDETYDAVEDFYAGQDMVMSEMTPFENKDAIAVTERVRRGQRPGLDRRPGRPRLVRPRRAARSSRTCSLGLAGLQEVYGLDNAEFRPDRARASSTPPSTTATPTRSTPSPPTRSCAAAPTRCSTTPSCSSARRTS